MNIQIKRIGTIILVITIATVHISCNKFLDKKANQNLSTPSTLDDLLLLIDDYLTMNRGYPEAGEESADNYYLLDDGWGYTVEQTQNLYLWQKYDKMGSIWYYPYQAIMQANVILEALPVIDVQQSEEERAIEIKGMALFIRAYNHFSLSQIFIPVYDKQTALNSLGLPLKMSADMNEKVERSSVQKTYDFIISDVKRAIPMLPVVPVKKYRPSLPAAYGLLSRIYLSMQEYALAGLYADSCLKLYSTLLDYNNVDATSDGPFAQFNDEVIYDSESYYPDAFYQPDARVDSNLYRSFEPGDIRREAFFKPVGDGSYNFKGNYTNLPYEPTMFTGIATDELYLTRAEASARQGDSLKALNDLNYLLSKRYNTSVYHPYTLPISGGILKLILRERRKELMFRGLRWTDLRRLNKEPQFADTLYRFINNKMYELLPGSDRYTLQIERSSVLISGIEQNP